MVAASHAERRLALRTVLGSCGYGEAEIAEGFPIWVPDSRRTIRADYVAFTRADQQDMSTSAIVAHVVDGQGDIQERWLPAATALAAPAVVLALPDRLTAWASAGNETSAGEIASVPVTDPREMAGRLSMLTPERVAEGKSYGFQTTLFPIDAGLLNESRNHARTYLTEIVEHVLSSMTPRGNEEMTSKLVIGALATLMIRDKTDLSSLATASTAALIDTTQQKYPGYFDWLTDLSTFQLDKFTGLVEFLSSQVNFASIEPAMVSNVYEQALVSKRRRREQGTYYTPPQLADQMFTVLPLEHLEPERRMILDPACGSGTLLLSAANRLTQLQTKEIDSRRWHSYLTSHLRGYDRDAFATEITKLCLLMTALPISNSWKVEVRDTLSMRMPPDDQPSVIVSNPPWGYEHSPGKTTEKANTFLSWMLDNLADDGFLSCVVPLSWMNRENSKGTRELLLSRATLLEVWRLPESVFGATSSTTAPAVIVAQKKSKGHARGRVTLVKTVRDASLATFYSTGSADEAYLVDPGPDGGRLVRGPISRAVEDLDGFTTAGAAAEVHNGFPALPRRPTRTPGDATHLELGSLRSLHGFGSVKADELIPVCYPEDYYRVRASDDYVRAHKVVVVAKRFGTSNPWRIAVGYDLTGVCPREMFHMVIPRKDWGPWQDRAEWDRFCALMAVLGSGLASCWIDENEPTRNISTHRLESIPFPEDPGAISELASAGNAMAEAVQAADHEELESAAHRLEETVGVVYRLSAAARYVIATRLANSVAFEGVVRYPQNPRLATRLREPDGALGSIPSFGHVSSADEDGLRMWISGVTGDSGVDVPPLPQIPGWLCQEDVDFRIDGHLEDLTRARFSFHTQDWLTREALTKPRLVRVVRTGYG